MVKLGINIDHVATLRQARLGTEPDLLELAFEAIKGGADQITVHLREDRRHIQDFDVINLKKNIKVPLNLEMSLNEEIVDFACKILPFEICLVPENRQELTTEGGLDIVKNFEKLQKATRKLKNCGIKISIFVDAEEKQIFNAKELAADIVEIHTGTYANAKNKNEAKVELSRIEKIAKIVAQNKIQLNAGHGLNYQNVKAIAKVAKMDTLNIGHSIVSRALKVGMKQAVSEMKAILC